MINNQLTSKNKGVIYFLLLIALGTLAQFYMPVICAVLAIVLTCLCIMEIKAYFAFKASPVQRFPVGSWVKVIGCTRTKHYLFVQSYYLVVDHFNGNVVLESRTAGQQQVHVDDLESLKQSYKE